MSNHQQQLSNNIVNIGNKQKRETLNQPGFSGNSAQPQRAPLYQGQMSGLQSPGQQTSQQVIVNASGKRQNQAILKNNFVKQAAVDQNGINIDYASQHIINSQQQISRLSQNKAVFEYDKINDKFQGSTISGGFDMQPQFSVHSPQRNHDNRRDFQNNKQNQMSATVGSNIQKTTPIQYSSMTNPLTSIQGDSAVRGRRLGNKELDVVCSIGSQEVFRDLEMLQSYSSQGLQHLSNQLVGQQQNSNQNSNQIRERSEQSRDGTRSTSNKNHNSNNTNAFKTRKSSTDSQGARQGRFNSQGRSDKKRGKSTSNSQSRGSSKNNNPHENRIAGLNYQNAIQAKNQGNPGKTLVRPSSAKNLKNVPSVTSMQNLQKNLVNSPTQANLRREPSTNLLPPKNPKQTTVRNQNFTKLHMPLYQSVGAHPTTGHSQSSHQSNSTSNKRAPSASSERKTMNLGLQKAQTLHNNFVRNEEGNINTFSPLRNNRHHAESVSTLPTSGQKNFHSGDKNSQTRNKKQKLKQSNGKLRSPGGLLNIQEQQNLQNLSPNIGRVRPEQYVINEELKEDSFTRQPMSSFDASDLNNGQQNMFNIQFDPSNPGMFSGASMNNLGEQNPNFDSQDSSISLRMNENFKPVNAMSHNNLHQFSSKLLLQQDPSIKEEIQRTLRQHLNQEEEKKRKKNITQKNKENINKLLTMTSNANQDNKSLATTQSQPQLLLAQKRMTQDQMRQLMEQKLMASNLNLAKKMKRPVQQKPDHQHEQQRKELLEQKQRRQQSREQHNRQREELHEIRVMVQDTLKQPLKTSTSNSQTRRPREQSKSQQRPFSAKVGSEGSHNQQLLIKMPPVSIESGSPYDIMNLQNSQNLNQLQMSETSPMKTNKYDHRGSTLSGVASEAIFRSDQQLLMSNTNDLFKKTVKRENSKRRKQGEEGGDPNSRPNNFNSDNVLHGQSTKALNAQLLKQKIDMKFDTYKAQMNQQLQQRKLKKGSKAMKSQKVIEIQRGDDKLAKRGMQQRSKSKKRIDDEKENRRLSISPPKEKIGSKEPRSGTKSRSDKKRRKQQKVDDPTKITDSQYQSMKLNVIELLKQQSINDQGKNTRPVVDKQVKLGMNKNLKSQTVANLHQALQEGALKKSQIQITKSMLKNLQMRKQSQKSSNSQSNNFDGDKSSSLNQELSFNNPQNQNQNILVYPPLDHNSASHANLMISSHPGSMMQLLDQQQYLHHLQKQNEYINPQIYMSQGNFTSMKNLDELTPIIQAKVGKHKQQNINVMSDKNLLLSSQQQMQEMMGSTDQLNKYTQSIRPIDSLQSFQLGLNNGLGQSREDLSIFKSHDRMEARNTDQQLMRVENQLDYRPQSTLNLHSNQLRSRSGSIETHSSNVNQQKQKSNKKKKSNKKTKPATQESKKEIQPVQLNLVSPTKAQQQLLENMNARQQNSGSKTRKSLQRKGSAGYKRNNIQGQQLPLTQMNTIGSVLGGVQQQQNAFSTTNKAQGKASIPLINNRPKSAAIQPNQQMLELIQQKKQQQLHQQQLQSLDQFTLVKKITQSIVTVQKNLKRFLAKKHVKIMLSEKAKAEKDLQDIQQKYWSQSQQQNLKEAMSGFRSSVDSQKGPLKHLFPSDQNLHFNNNINILDNEESKGDGGMMNSNSMHSQKSFDSQKSKLSRSEVNLKNIIARESENLKKQTVKSDVINKVPRIGSAGTNQQKVQVLDTQKDSLSNKFTDRRGSQQSQKDNTKNLTSQLQQQVQQLPKSQKPIQNMILEKEIPRISRNLNDQFDSMASINRLSEELNFKDEPTSKQIIDEKRLLNDSKNGHDSFLKSLVMNESQNKAQQQQQQQNPQQIHKKLAQNYQLNQVMQPSSTKNQQSQLLLQQQLQQQQQQNSHFEILGSNIYNTSHAIHSNSQILSSDEREMSWQFDRKSFQEFFDNNNNRSQILQDESKRQSIEALGASATKAQIPNILNQYESYINEMTKKAELGKQELSKYKDRMYLSPASQKKKSQLEKWVEKQEHKIQQKRNFMNENMNDLIMKMQQDIDLTKRKINMGNAPGMGLNSARKDSNTSLRFNVSHDISQICDVSNGNITGNSSVNATPRIPISSHGPITAQQQIGVSNSSSSFKKQQQQDVSNRSQSVEQPKQSQQQNQGRKLFDYKLAQQSHSRERTVPILQQNQELLSSENSKKSSDLAVSKFTNIEEIKSGSQDFNILQSHQRSRVSNSVDQNLSNLNNNSKRSIKTDKSQKLVQPVNQILDTDDIKLELKTEEEKRMSLKSQRLGSNKNGDVEFMDDSDLNDRSNIFRSELLATDKDNKISKSMINNAAADKSNKAGGQQQQINHSNSIKFDVISSQNAADDPYPVDEDSQPLIDDQENESLSKMEPPQFQSPTMSAISPNQQLMRDYNSDDDDKNAAPAHPQQLKPFQINKYDINGNDSHEIEDEDIDADDILISGGKVTSANDNKQPSINSALNRLGVGATVVDQVLFSGPDSEREYSNAFLALKEPEHPINVDKLQQVREEKQEREVQTEILTDYILTLLVEQMKYNMFPKRVIIMKSPSKGVSGDDSINNSRVDDELRQGDISEQSLLSSIRSISEANQLTDEKLSSPKEGGLTQNSTATQNQSPNADQQILQNLLAQQVEPKKKRVRGIKTTMRVVDQYIGQVFQKVKDSEDEFVENLSTPLNKDPLEILLHLQNAVFEGEMENAVAYQQSVLPVDLYLDLERNKADVQIAEHSSDDEEAQMNKSMMGEWENIHNKVIFDGINEALDNFRPYGLRGPPMPWSQQTRTLTYKNGQQIDSVLKQVRLKVMEWARTFSGALPCSELLQEYGIKGPLDEDKLNLLREERLALVLAAEIEENEMLWTDYEYEETQTKLDVADMILEFLAEEVAQDLNKIQQNRSSATESNANDTTNLTRALNE